MQIGKFFITGYRLFRKAVVFGVSIDINKHSHHPCIDGIEDETKEPIIDEDCITIEFLIWGVDIQISHV